MAYADSPVVVTDVARMAAARPDTAASPPLDQATIILYMKALFGTQAEQLLNAYEATGNTIQFGHFWSGESAISGGLMWSWHTQSTITIDTDIKDPTKAAMELYGRLVDASGRTLNGMQSYLMSQDLMTGDTIELIQQSRESAIRQVAADAGALADAYLRGITLAAGSAGNLVLTVNDLSQGNYLAVINILPLALSCASRAAAGVTLKFGGETAAELDQATVSRLVVVASSAGESAPAEFVREVAHGEAFEDILNDMKALTWQTGKETALVSVKDAEGNVTRMIVMGGPGGVDFGKGWENIKTIFLHLHPDASPPSVEDFQMLTKLDQPSSHVYNMIGGLMTKITKQGQ